MPIRRYRAVQQHMLRTDAHDTPTAVARVYRRTKVRWLRKIAKGIVGSTLPTCTPMASAVTGGGCPRVAARFTATTDINSRPIRNHQRLGNNKEKRLLRRMGYSRLIDQTQIAKAVFTIQS